MHKMHYEFTVKIDTEMTAILFAIMCGVLIVYKYHLLAVPVIVAIMTIGLQYYVSKHKLGDDIEDEDEDEDETETTQDQEMIQPEFIQSDVIPQKNIDRIKELLETDTFDLNCASEYMTRNGSSSHLDMSAVD